MGGRFRIIMPCLVLNHTLLSNSPAFRTKHTLKLIYLLIRGLYLFSNATIVRIPWLRQKVLSRCILLKNCQIYFGETELPTGVTQRLFKNLFLLLSILRCKNYFTSQSTFPYRTLVDCCAKWIERLLCGLEEVRSTAMGRLIPRRHKNVSWGHTDYSHCRSNASIVWNQISWGFENLVSDFAVLFAFKNGCPREHPIPAFRFFKGWWSYITKYKLLVAYK